MIILEAEEQSVYVFRVIELGMERGNKLATLACGHDIAIDCCQYFYSLAHRLDVWSTDECHRYRMVDALELRLGIKTAQLTSVGVATHGNIHGGKSGVGLVLDMLGEKYHSCACSKDRHSIKDALADRCKEPRILEQLAQCGAFSAWDNQTVDGLLEIF